MRRMFLFMGKILLYVCLEFGVLWRAGEGDDIADVLHAGDEEDEALETESETTVGAASVFAGVEVPPHVLHGDMALLNLAHELVVALLADRTADDLADLWEKHVGALYGLFHLLAVENGFLGIDLHVEGLDALGVVGHDDGLLEVLFHEVTLVLAGQVVAPFAGELELLSVLDGFLQDADTLGVGEAHKVGLQHAFETLYEALVHHLVEELEVLAAVVERPFHAELDEVLFEVHEFGKVDEGHFGLHHPELSQVARGVAVLGAERGTEGVDGTQGGGCKLAFELSAHGEGSLLAEEVVGVDDVPLLVLLQVVEVLGSDLEHLAGTFAVAGGDEGCVEIEIAVLVEIGVDGHGHVVANAEHSTKGVGSGTQVCHGAQVFPAGTLLLEGIGVVAVTENLNGGGLYFAGLSCGGAFHELSHYAEAGTCGDAAERFLVEIGVIAHYLNVLDGASVV